MHELWGFEADVFSTRGEPNCPSLRVSNDIDGPSKLARALFTGRWPDWSPTARVQLRSSDSLYLALREWPRLPFTARIERAPFHRARSASKKGTWPLPPHPTPLPKYCLWVYHEPVHQGTLFLRGVWVSVVRQVLG
jgi:hypothetical protein